MAVRMKGSWWETYYRDPVTKKQRTRVFKTKQEAEREDRRLKYLLEFDRDALIAEDAARTKTPEKTQPEQSEQPEQPDSTQYTLANICQQTVKWYGLDPVSNHTHRTYIDTLHYIVRHFGENTDIRTITTQSLIGFYQSNIDRGVKPQSIKLRFTYIARLFKVAVNLGLASDVPVFPKLRKVPHVHNIPFTEEEVQRLYDTVKVPYMKRVILLGARFGMRVGYSEALSLKWSDIDFEHWVINLRAAKKNKYEPVRVLPIPEAYRQLFSQWHTEDTAKGIEYVCTNTSGKRIYKVDCGVWHRLLRKAGITRDVRPYDLRHTFATNMLRSGVPATTVAKLMGHTNLTMLFNHYQYIGVEDKLDALSALAKGSVGCMV